ncbi:MAG: TetR/AcrR family transcriptional regulator, partial [Desulfobacterota bacterium]|nr:TetR/AcrR family transcriptional regulator [Thermodesulfobacteriota bacterium]
SEYYMYSEEDIKKRKERIFEAAVQCFNESGYDNASMESIAQCAGISKGGLYHYFPSKKELFLELFDYKVHNYFDQMKSFLIAGQAPEEKLRILVAKAGEILKQHEDFYRFCLEFLSMGVRDHEIKAVMTRFYKNSIDTFKEIIEEGIARGFFLPVDPVKVARSLYLSVMGAFFTFFSVDVDFDLADQHVFDLDKIILSIKKV